MRRGRVGTGVEEEDGRSIYFYIYHAVTTLSVSFSRENVGFLILLSILTVDLYYFSSYTVF